MSESGFFTNTNPLYWLPCHVNFKQAMAAAKADGTVQEQLTQLRYIANHNLDFTQIMRVGRRLHSLTANLNGNISGFSRIKLAILGSSTVEHLLPAIQVAALRKGLIADIYVAPYGQYRQEILNNTSPLYEFKPEVVLLALNAQDIGIKLPLNASIDEVAEKVDNRITEWVQLWQIIHTQLHATIIHQTVVVPVERLFGQYDNLVPASPTNILFRLNHILKVQAAEHKILLLDVDSVAAYIGKHKWCDHSLWHHAKQDIPPAQAPLYGDYVSRILAAIRGLSHKCLVLDLDNTLWGGVIGDDGLSGIELGQGSAIGEAYQAFQTYVKNLKERGVILAVCSKNDEVNALEPFADHPEMVLRREDISVFIANWKDKATNIERIASELNIGLDSLVFVDDNPFEREVVKKFLPTVSVLNIPEDPAWYIRCLSDSGYFEATIFSQEDLIKTEQYLANKKRHALKDKAHSIDIFLQQLNMKLTVSPWDELSIPRVTQLINKSNQFNLTTRRYTESQVRQMKEDGDVLCLQIRLQDDFGDNGLISVIIAKPKTIDSEKALHIDTWLMSCRVLGRQVEQEVLNVLSNIAKTLDYNILLGEYISTKKNGMVQEHYPRLGFEPMPENSIQNGSIHSFWKLNLNKFQPTKTFIQSVFAK